MRYFTATRRYGLALMLWLCVGVMALAQSGGSGFGTLAEYLPPTGQQGAWHYVNTGETFEIENLSDPQAIQYFYAGFDPARQGRRQLEAGLSLHPDSRGAAGLLYGLDRDRGHYHLLTLDAGGTVTLFRRDPSGFRPMMEQTSSAFRPGYVNTLSLAENGDEISFALNGTELGAIGGDLFGTGHVGIAALGDARAIFTHFTDTATGDRAARTPDATPRPAPDDALRLRRITIEDTAGPAGAMTAYETLIPQDWKTNGGVAWNHTDGTGACFTGARLIWGAGTEDDSYSLAFLDPISWGVSTLGQNRFVCLQQDLMDAEAVMRAYFQAISGTIQVAVTEVERPPELTPLRDMVAQSWQESWRGASAAARTWADAVLITARVTSATGENDGQIIAVTRHVENTVGQTSFRQGQSALILGISTPLGKLEDGHPGFAAILNNLRVNPQWQQAEAAWWAQRLNQGRADLAASAKAARSNASVGDMMFESWKKRQAITDASHERSINSIWEVEPYTATSGQTVLLNQNYNHAWELDNGAIVMTNDANFNPMQSYNQTGQQLNRAQ